MRRLLLTAPLISWLTLAPAAAQPAPPIADVDRALEFLRNARVDASREIGRGVTRSRKITLSDGTWTHAAQFQPVDEERYPTQLDTRGADLRFKDYWGYNVAAFELARLLGWDALIPPTVERSIEGQRGAVTWWVDDVQFDEEARAASKARPPDDAAWTREVQRLRVFAELVADSDRNQGNILITRDWRVVLIDFTRAFRLNRQLREPARVRQVEAGALDRLRGLTSDAVTARLRPWLTSAEIRALMARRDALVRHFEVLIAERGEGAVLLR